MDRYNRKVQNMRKSELRHPDLKDFVRFVEEKILLRNDPLLSREKLHEYAGQKKQSGNAKHKKLKNCYTNPNENVTKSHYSVNPRKKCAFVMAVMI